MKALFFNSNKSIIEENYEEFHPVEAEKENSLEELYSDWSALSTDIHESLSELSEMLEDEKR